ncbi:electron transfer flavoprotein subunit alpha/FixB family protein [Flavobacteriaceae bacterium]|nr:electron transfer flavoprotein subunit alpha/FixB family protein [Flavobacteriaceae bacterium]
MSVLVYADASEGNYKKSTLEVVSYGKEVANQLGSDLTVVTINANNPEELYTYGANKVLAVKNADLVNFNAKITASIVVEAAQKTNNNIVVLDSTANGKYLAPVVSAKLQAGYASNVVAAPVSTSPLTLKRKVFSGKVFSTTEITTENKVIGLSKNSFGVVENPTDGSTEEFSPATTASTVSSVSVEKASGKVAIADADIVVAGGRGLKAAENFNLIEDLADVLEGAVACSKPVSDMGWRPHGEHVGQTGKPVASNLYIAVAISGAIQHLAGVNASKVKVVINTDAEAPFFKAADYGIVGDAFTVVPELVEKLKAFKNANA